MRTKIFALIYRGSGDSREFLLLRNNSEDPTHGGDYWYTVTGAVDGEETFEKAALRELDEETGITNIIEIKNLDTVFRYNSRDIDCEEFAYSVYVDDEVKHLNEENIDFKWVSKEKFLSTIRWFGDKSVLEGFLEKI